MLLKCSTASRATAPLSMLTRGNSEASRSALTSTTGNPVRFRAAAIAGESTRAMIPSPAQPFSHEGTAAPRACSVNRTAHRPPAPIQSRTP